MRMPRPAQMLERGERVSDESLVERAEILRAESERIASDEMMEVPVDELPVEAVVVGNEDRSVANVLGEPVFEVRHDFARLVEGQRLLAAEATDFQGVR